MYLKAFLKTLDKNRQDSANKIVVPNVNNKTLLFNTIFYSFNN